MFSIIMPAYNVEKYIKDAIESVLKQTYVHFELLIIDDCSTDQTKQIILEYINKDSRIKLLCNDHNSGVAITRNKGIKQAIYPYLCFLDSDDLWTPDKLEKYAAVFEAGHNVLYSFYTRFTDQETLNLVKAPEKIEYSELLKGNCIGNLTGAYNCQKLGKVYQKPVRHEDYLMWLEVLKKGKEAICVPENLAYYRVGQNSLSGNKFKSLYWTWKIYREELKLNGLYSTYLLLHSVVRAFFKRI
ncbi:glycosyltransferase family 2 protein [Wohlfahrtiimonas chitiniclastica]|uniref:glycosyltransferase family 2 protein n=1 Tax=Wohlfahrtiimonas chitiniclastica TaxID=400946 RepID=UPI001BCF1F02|nr:glycosyltransferase family 2 protein [Wohlfahrtiimonas chitiniclastica]MBS7836626.1 glycosyltransferase family 2 protein [Wohlfahrtiimonas chitiniclastica]